jgi:hypothetical protein
MKRKSMLLAALVLIGGAAHAGAAEVFVAMSCFPEGCVNPRNNPPLFKTADECKRHADIINSEAQAPGNPARGRVTMKCFKMTAPTTTFEPIDGRE